MLSPRSASALLALCFAAVHLNELAQSPAVTQPKKKRFNELQLAGLRPGRDSLSRAHRLYGKPFNIDTEGEIWRDFCHRMQLVIDYDDATKKIQTIRVSYSALPADCLVETPGPSWFTSKGLRISDSVDQVINLYGPPDSRSPSTRGNQQLELLYYAFDWAGADVPQVMEVLCTPEKDGKPGRVVEITLAAPSL
jgi:hypothetical protein